MADIKKTSKKNKSKNFIIRGITSSILASLCCVTPLVVVLIGIGSVSVALSFLRYRIYFLSFGFVFLVVATYVYLKRDYGKCNLNTVAKEKYSILASTILMVAIYVVLTYFVIPPLLISNVQNIVTSEQKTISPSSFENASQLKITVSGMTCACNVADIQYNLMQMKGVLNVTIDYGTKTGLILYNSSQINKNQIFGSSVFSSTYHATELS